VKKRSSKNAAARGGFTIVEVLLAMGILLLGSVAIIAFLTFGGATARHAQLRTQAAAAVEAVVADIDRHLFPYTDGALGDPVELSGRKVPGSPGVLYSARAFPNPELEGEYRVEIEMSWESGGMKRSKSWSMIRLKELPFGERLRREFIEKSGGFKTNATEDARNGTQDR